MCCRKLSHFAGLVALLQLAGCADNGGAKVYQALCDEMASTRGRLHLTAIQVVADIEAVPAAEAGMNAGNKTDREARRAGCHRQVDHIYRTAHSEIKKLEFGAGLLAASTEFGSRERNPLADSHVKTAFQLVHVAARLECETGNIAGALQAMSEGLRDYDRVMLRAFDACETVGWDRSRWDQAEPVYPIP